MLAAAACILRRRRRHHARGRHLPPSPSSPHRCSARHHPALQRRPRRPASPLRLPHARTRERIRYLEDQIWMSC
ncbi:hypothetical protein OsJ_13816 [Oryza sativa Japonica Group]|uniref:Uncharacterized protein n=1 Tax=Oryza sativa subsp. japonica TaxID=39947 RepID=B9FDP2_ORYSJ|nr:hypothetical protein OsJ_13816 [Oryza sativa Japonica Group]